MTASNGALTAWDLIAFGERLRSIPLIDDRVPVWYVRASDCAHYGERRATRQLEPPPPPPPHPPSLSLLPPSPTSLFNLQQTVVHFYFYNYDFRFFSVVVVGKCQGTMLLGMVVAVGGGKV